MLCRLAKCKGASLGYLAEKNVKDFFRAAMLRFSLASWEIYNKKFDFYDSYFQKFSFKLWRRIELFFAPFKKN